jgi:outer membrane protein OmpA-like peptidoglycan-associated protein
MLAVGVRGSAKPRQGSTAAAAEPPPTVPVSSTSAAPPTTRAPTAPLATLANGQPLPVLCVYDGPTISLIGVVPSAAAVQRLEVIAKTYSKVPNAQVVPTLRVDPRVPSSVGVRVIEMQAARWATGSAAIEPEHAIEFDRLVRAMEALPNITALVIGHSDQRGDAATNLALSQARADAVVAYVVAHGIAASRLTAQAVGDGDPLTQQSDAAGLALNRRIEFIVYGLLAGT